VSGRLPIDAGHVRRGALFLINIGAPLVVGVIFGQSQAALAATIVGMLFSFADNDGPLCSRLRLLILDGGCLAAGGIAGYFSRNKQWQVNSTVRQSDGSVRLQNDDCGDDAYAYNTDGNALQHCAVSQHPKRWHLEHGDHSRAVHLAPCSEASV
jgi:hypothetical protein